MNEESRGEGVIAVAVVAVLLILICLIGGGATIWFVSVNQRLAVQRALVAEQQARAMAEAARAQAEAARSEIESEAPEDTSEPNPPADAESSTRDDREEPSDLDPLRWIVGSWIQQNGENVAEEVWLAPRGKIMLGMNRSSRGTQRAFFEYLRIESSDDGISYVANPLGKAETAFKMKKMSATMVVFENPEHDFPQRIIYQLDGELLQARIEGVVNGEQRSQQWKWNRTSQ